MGGGHKKRNVAILRLAVDLFIVLGILYAHWAVACIFVVAGLIVFRRFYEAIAAGVLFDMLYGAAAGAFFGFPYAFSAASIVLYAVAAYVKTRIRIYDMA